MEVTMRYADPCATTVGKIGLADIRAIYMS